MPTATTTTMVAGTPRSSALSSSSSSSPRTPGGANSSSHHHHHHHHPLRQNHHRIIQHQPDAVTPAGSRTKSTTASETRAVRTPPRHRPPLSSSTNGTNHHPQHNSSINNNNSNHSNNTNSPTISAAPSSSAVVVPPPLPLSEGEITPTASTTPTGTPLSRSSSHNNNNSSNMTPTAPRHNQHLLPPQQQQPQQQPERATIDGICNDNKLLDTVEQEQALFEQRLCEDNYGIAVRKINQYGKSSLRYVKCIELDYHNQASSRSVSSIGSWGRRNSFGHKTTVVGPNAASSNPNHQQHQETTTKSFRALAWGKKKDVQIALDRFVSVRKGKTTERTRRNPSHASRVLSLLTDDPRHPSLDIEAPTRLDRDKFARAFARFLQVPLEGETGSATDHHSVSSAEVFPTASSSGDMHSSSNKTAMSRESEGERLSTSMSAPGDVVGGTTTSPTAATNGTQHQPQQQPQPHPSPPLPSSSSPRISPHSKLNFPPPIPPTSSRDNNNNNYSTHKEAQKLPAADSFHSSQPSSTKQSSSKVGMVSVIPVVPSTSPPPDANDDEPGANNQNTDEDDNHNNDDQGSAVSSLTGHGYDQELVEELHHALNDLRAELEESRAEAARAVKVAEQAIQSAERNNSQDWQNTVTHKAAEAAALAQKRSAEAMAKQRLAEERLESERRTAAFWRKQAEFAEEEAGKLQTRAAAAEVQRAAMEEQLESERRLTSSLVGSMKQRFSSSESQQRTELETALERNRALEVALSSTRSDFETSKLEDSSQTSSTTDGGANVRGSARRKLGFGRKKKTFATPAASESKPILSRANTTSSMGEPASPSAHLLPGEGFSPDQLQKLYTESVLMRQKFEALRRATADELQKLPMESKQWAEQVVQAFESSQAEVSRLRNRMAAESASRRKLLHEVQDLRGCVRVYCRPTPPPPNSNSLVSLPSQDTIMLHREFLPDSEDSQETSGGPMSFEFDRVFGLNSLQQDVYSEVEEVCLGVLDGYNICVLGYGQTGKGKTRTILGDSVVSDDGNIKMRDYGVQLRAVEQLFSIASRRSDRYNDTFTLTIVEVYNERLCDLLAGTQTGEHHGQALVAESSSKSSRKKKSDGDETSSRQPKLEIRTDVHGDTVVQGLLSVTVESFQDFLSLWEECLAARLHRLADLEVDPSQYEASSHVIATLKVVSANIATGMGTVGKLEFVDLAGADLVPKPPSGGGSSPSKSTTTEDNFFAKSVNNNNTDLCFANRSLETLTEVVAARIQFARSVPYRNSTLTHLLRDSLEADTKVLLIACVSADPEHAQETLSTLRFASRIRRVHIGKATKHQLSTP